MSSNEISLEGGGRVITGGSVLSCYSRMQVQAPSSTAEVLLLAEDVGDAGAVREAATNNKVTVLDACPDVLPFLRRQDRFNDSPRPDLILLDLDLLNPADCEMLQEIKEDEELRRIPVVVLASGDAGSVFQAYDLHANAYVVKPSERDEFIRVLKVTLNFWLQLARLPRE